MRRVCPYILIWLLIIILTGCGGLQLPCGEVEDRPYIQGVYTCMHKSQDYAQCLRDYGYDAHVVIDKVRGYNKCSCLG